MEGKHVGYNEELNLNKSLSFLLLEKKDNNYL